MPNWRAYLVQILLSRDHSPLIALVVANATGIRKVRLKELKYELENFQNLSELVNSEKSKRLKSNQICYRQVEKCVKIHYGTS